MTYVETPMSPSLTDRSHILRQLLGMVVSLYPHTGLRQVVDLGCGHCIFLKLARVFGWDVTGVDARLDRVPPECRDYVIQQRVQDADLSPYDLILCLGIFYHLTFEAQIDLIEKFAGKPVIVDTHYCTAKAYVSRRHGDEYYAGTLFREGDGLTSSFENVESFWPLEKDLVRMLGKRHDVVKWLPEHHPGRSFYLLMPRVECK